MLFFIFVQEAWLYAGTLDLNTSHVILYQTGKIKATNENIDLNTSHVILYQADRSKSSRQSLNLNTSHVILYRDVWLTVFD